MIEIPVKTASEYSVFIENQPINDLFQKIISFVGNKKYIVVISEKVEKLYGKLLPFDKSVKFILKDGEKEKTFSNCIKILEFAMKNKLTRFDAIISVGGGVAGDLAGFASSIYMRGIDFIQVPTTLLACVDSSAGGKTAVNTKFGKNLAGTFYQPRVVFINPKFLKTLDDRQYKTGLGEVVKYAFIEKSCQCNEEFNLINFLSENTDKIFERDEKILKRLIEICIRLKVSVVEKDEKENGLRRILNFGHTYAHAVEKITNYKKYTHGETVAEGIKFAFELALQKNLIDKNYKYFAFDLIKKFNFREIEKYDTAKLAQIMRLDKKSDGKKIKFILPSDYSRAEEFEIGIDEITAF